MPTAEIIIISILVIFVISSTVYITNVSRRNKSEMKGEDFEIEFLIKELRKGNIINKEETNNKISTELFRKNHEFDGHRKRHKSK